MAPSTQTSGLLVGAVTCLTRCRHRWSPGEGGAALTAVFGNERVYLGAMFSPGARDVSSCAHNRSTESSI